MTKIRLIKPAIKLPPPPPCDFTADEHLAAEGLLMLSQSIFVSSYASKNPTPAAAKPPISAMHAKNPTPAAANPTQAASAPPIAALCANNPIPAAATPPSAAAVPIKKTQDFLSLLAPSPSNLPYVCEFCGAAFKRYQSLGGHKTCHRPKPTTTASAALTITGSRNNDRLHECTICHKPFSTGQALGGHMRKHYEGKIGGPNKSPKTSLTGSPGRASSEVTTIIEVDDGPSNASSRVVLDFDLNLPCPESDYVFE